MSYLKDGQIIQEFADTLCPACQGFGEGWMWSDSCHRRVCYLCGGTGSRVDAMARLLSGEVEEAEKRRYTWNSRGGG